MQPEEAGAGAAVDSGRVEAWPSAPDVVPDTRCQFVLGPPRHFLYPAILLLLAEQPRHGYTLVEALSLLGLGTVDRPSVYRSLADLERDELIHGWSEPSTAGSMRRVYALTGQGELALEAWMSVVAQERTSLDNVLQRYWYSNASRIGSLGDGGPVAEAVADLGGGRARFAVASDRSALVVEARSNVGPIAFNTSSLRGWIEVELQGGLIAADRAPSARLEARVSDLTSGNALYDNELLRRVDARRFPVVSLELASASRLGEGNCYRLAGDLTMHGVTRRLHGSVTAAVLETRRRAGPGATVMDRRLSVTGEDVLDIRSFDMAVPSARLFKLYPDVRLHLRLEADEVTAPPDA